MPIDWDDRTREIHLRNGLVSLILRVLDDGSLGTVHFGAPLGRASYAHSQPPFTGWANRVGEAIPLALPVPGNGDLRAPALVVEQADGSTVLQPVYAGHRISGGKPALPAPLPATYVESDGEADTVEIDLRDGRSGLLATVRLTIFRDVPLIARSMVLRNEGAAPLTVRCAMSASVDLPDAGWELLRLSGAWARERHVVRERLAPGRQSVGSIAGASSAQHNPFVALLRPTTTETAGEAYGFSLVYSGNFLAEAEVDQYATTRVRIGINPEGFAWRLEPHEELTVPEAVVGYSPTGLGDLSHAYHRLYRDRLARGAWRDRPRPILLNNWEGTYFEFDEDRLVAIAAAGKELGIELFVLDDGWFGRRDDDTTSLGDWFVDRRKLPNGIDGVARRIVDLGLSFGIWIEPEMVSERSDLFRAHPDWAIGVPGRPRTESRQQLVLDMGRPEVVDHLFEVIAAVLGSAPISYVKWDMNRNITEPYSVALPPDRQGEAFHRYILGLYDLYARLGAAFPDILFESCASGGGRFDPGLLAYAPQAWTSDDTDAIERLAIQWGTSIVYPVSSMGAHVSAIPNHQVGRLAPLSTRAAVAFFGIFGYELDSTRLTADERSEVADQVAFYARWRDVLQRGRFHRLVGPFDGRGNETAWMSVGTSGDAVVGWYRPLAVPVPGPTRLRLRGLVADASYRVSVWPAGESEVGRANEGLRRGDELMSIGLALDVAPKRRATDADFGAWVFSLERQS